MKLRITIIVILLTSFFASCYSSMHIPKEERNWEKMSDVSSINGIYSNLTADSSRNVQDSFWRHFKPFKRSDFYTGDDNNTDLLIELNVLDEKRIEMSLIDEGVIVSSKKFKYKIIDNQIRIKNNLMVKGVPLILGGYHHEKPLLSLSKDDDLIAIFEGEVGGGLFIILFGEPIKDKMILRRIE